MVKLESAVIVENEFGKVATIRFSDYTKDRIISSSDPDKIYKLTVNYIRDVLNG